MIQSKDTVSRSSMIFMCIVYARLMKIIDDLDTMTFGSIVRTTTNTQTTVTQKLNQKYVVM